VYHINAVDVVTQWQVVAATARTGQACPAPPAGSPVGKERA
jgi:hypothetical protein